MKKQSKFLVLGGIVALGFSANAQAVVACAGVAGSGTAVPASTTNFVRDAFTPKCSANVAVNYAQDTSLIAVRGGSSKGMHTFGGTSEGGGILQCESTSAATPSATSATVTAGATATGCI